MPGNNSKNSNTSDVSTNQSRNRRKNPREEESNEETSIITSNNNGSSYGTVSQTITYAPIKSREQTHGKPSLERRESVIEEENNEDLQIEIPATEPEKEGPVAWSSLPHKRQLAILTCARLSEPLVQTSLRSYLFYQLKSFDPSLPDSVIASQAGIMAGSFALAQLTTAMLWGRFSDRSGRKRVLLIGLGGTAFSCLGFGFAQNFWQALVFRMIGGALNGNVGVMRTMISEIVKEKKYQSRAFLLLPMCGNIGTIIGPILGGLLADPAGSYPSLFGGIKWLEKYPYAPPNLLSACFLASACLAVIFALEETHEMYAHKEDWGIKTGRAIKHFFRRLRKGSSSKIEYTAILSTNSSPTVGSTPITPKSPKRVAPRYKNRLPFRQVFTYNVVCTLVSHALLAFSMGTFQSIWYSFLSTPAYNPSHPSKSLPADYTPHPPLKFTGGIGLPPRDVGLAMSILGVIGITMQLFLYPIVNTRFGTIRSWRIFLYGFPIAYTLAPFLSLIPSLSPPPSQKTGPLIWISLTLVLLIQTISRTFAGPATTILINNCSPHPSVLGTIHGMGQTASSAARTVGPALGGYLYGVGLSSGYVGLVFWMLTGMAGVTCLASTFVGEGDGHEIWLEGDQEAEEEARIRNRELGFNV
ncbi:6ad748d0-e784-45cb-8bc6-8d9bdf14791b [Sclerotinia trifoliorum]|uniref:6ad748d0-e784-45cb-8bc6-8d9bdf14791b n=1 Tax=Sclerotinia trifoliorum TaxID=28548 RepID=A0A8H2VUX3_9HELO|nr:6ad748d0-e784-45cb-8bc6-8d9bdf14791b [Sclerotinia trifoliorum]